MSARYRSLRAAFVARIDDLPQSKRAEAWRAYRDLPADHFDSMGSQAVHRERREAARALSASLRRMSTRIIVGALERELKAKAEAIRSAMWQVRNIHDAATGKERAKLDDARRLLNKAAEEYDAVAEELSTARADFNAAQNAVSERSR